MVGKSMGGDGPDPSRASVGTHHGLGRHAPARVRKRCRGYVTARRAGLRPPLRSDRWEVTDPIRVVHLLEHTTGWDDMHLREYAKDAAGMSLREGLDYDHHSRISRWRPGTRMAYCNSGPPVAAFVVDKLTGQHFEDYVGQNLFHPIGMKTATYFASAPGTATTLYHNDGKTPYRYWNILLRPAGSINASAN